MINSFSSLRDFLKLLKQRNLLSVIETPVDTDLEITEISRQSLHSDGPALLFKNPFSENQKYQIPVLTNLFASKERAMLALHATNLEEIRKIGENLSALRYISPPGNLSEIFSFFKTCVNGIKSIPKVDSRFGSMIKPPSCREVILRGDDVNLGLLPIPRCWSNDVAPLINWGCVVTSGSSSKSSWQHNIGVYRMQKLSRNQVIVRWLKHRGGAQHFCYWNENAKGRMPIAIFIGADPCAMLAAAIPAPEQVSEYSLAGLLNHQRLSLTKCLTVPLYVPSNAEIVLEGYIDLERSNYADEGPFGDHTGFYNAVEKFPVMEITAMTMQKSAIYVSTYTGKPPDEPSIIGEVFNEMLIPLLQKQFPEIVDFYLPQECCSYRMAVVSIRKQYPGHAKRIMMGVWSFLRQFLYTKFIVVVDANVNIRNWQDVMWVISTHMDFSRDTTILANTPIDYLDFASIEEDLGGKIGFDATKKIGIETHRAWGEEIVCDAKMMEVVQRKWSQYGIELPSDKLPSDRSVCTK